MLFRWDPTNKYIASVGVNRRVNIFDRAGQQIDEFALAGKPTHAPLQIEWDKEGENLAVLCDSTITKERQEGAWGAEHCDCTTIIY